MSAEEMQARVTREYRRFYSAGRVAAAALRGTFLRFRLLDRGQREYLKQFHGVRRVRRWLRLHVEYKYAPVAFLATGRARIKAMLKDPGYIEFLTRVRRVPTE
jgi:hypothetical protein